MKKIVTCILMISVLMVSIIGCSQEKKQTDKPSSNEATSKDSNDKTVDKDELKPVELKWYVIGNGDQDDIDKVEEEVNSYLKDKINVTLKLKTFDWGSYNEKLPIMIAAGEEFDICFTSSWTNNYFEQVSRKAFVPINDLLDQYAPKTKELLGEHFLSGSQINGINYAIPANKEKVASRGVLIQKEMVDKYNFDLSKVKTIEDLEPMLQIIKEKEPQLIPLVTPLDAALNHKDYDALGDGSTGVLRRDTDDYKVVMIYEQPEYKQYLDTIRSYYEKGYLPADVAAILDFMSDLKSGKVFMHEQSLKPGKDKEMSLATGIEWVQVELSPRFMATFDTVGSMQAISRTSENPERAMMFLELFNTDDYLNNLINFGIEGKHYVKVDDKRIKKGPENDKYNPGTTWMFGNVFINYLWETEDVDKWDKFIAFNKSAEVSRAMGFVFDTKSVKNEIAACTAAKTDYERGLITGTLDPDEHLPKLISALKAAGIDKVIAEKQRQLDEWVKANK